MSGQHPSLRGGGDTRTPPVGKPEHIDPDSRRHVKIVDRESGEIRAVFPFQGGADKNRLKRLGKALEEVGIPVAMEIWGGDRLGWPDVGDQDEPLS